MESLLFMLISVATLIGFDIMAAHYGVDSRERIDDDHARRVGF